MSFIPATPGTGTDHSCTVDVPIGNNITVAVGELVKTKVSSTNIGYLVNGTAAAASLGIVVALIDAYGNALPPTAYAAGSATSTTVDSVTAAADNETTLAKWARVETSRQKVWSAQVNGTLGTTASSPTATTKRFGGYIDVDSANTSYGRVLETTFIRDRSAGTVQNFFVWGVDPNDSTRLLVSLGASELIVEQK